MWLKYFLIFLFCSVQSYQPYQNHRFFFKVISSGEPNILIKGIRWFSWTFEYRPNLLPNLYLVESSDIFSLFVKISGANFFECTWTFQFLQLLVMHHLKDIISTPKMPKKWQNLKTKLYFTKITGYLSRSSTILEYTFNRLLFSKNSFNKKLFNI